jgi:hypothetical protein
MLHRESNSGAIDDLAHVVSKYCLSDALTKHSPKPDELVKAVETGNIRCVDMHPTYRSLIKHKAYLVAWLADHVNPRSFSSRKIQHQNKERDFHDIRQVACFMGKDVMEGVLVSGARH